MTVIEDREGDIYECFAFKPAGIEKLVRAAQDRRLADGSLLFSKAESWDEAGWMSVDPPAAPGRKARQAQPKQQTPHPGGARACAAWVFARPGGWTGYYGKPGHIVMLRGLPSSTASNMAGACEICESRRP